VTTIRKLPELEYPKLSGNMISNDNTDNKQDYFRKKLARWLGISYDELEEYAEDVECNHYDIDQARFGYYLQFSFATPIEITNKIKRLDTNNIIYFNLEELDAHY
jgi:hypothetical protein